jgi:membrane protein implicated in regulation of membrane protease activity
VTYAAVGALFSTEPAWAMGLSIALPVVLWLVFRPFLSRKDARHDAP